ncbi:MAG: diguanylate cyclase response regulator [Geobacteraceae bacterium GWC2_55_20]|nr:MAG: diguanylate cyclase response regulator [Geobacteraceae bacterium GWC2_55_20]OGU22824.1 MAG: diguanylate cyclase response regulator [Geobacteraceae bacterium GWF2_54_21]HBA71994.1 diguanylate cyclase response regulator [Geobacter sp.]HCE67723.1 diguanylate cyclase response regulator [Geobacter sp.]
MTVQLQKEILTLPRILVVEDDPLSCAMIEMYLEQEGYPCVTAPNGREALDLFKREPFPIVVTDWLMPEMDGTALCHAIRSLKTDSYTYLILLTSQNSPDAVVEGLESGADDYLVKPVNPAELKVRLKGARRILDLEDALRKSLYEIRELSIHDPLTGAFNRGYMDQQLNHEVQRAYRYRHQLSVMICDLDHFKQVNDNHGHHAGDSVLKRCIGNITSSIRQNIDWVARFGGEEFVIVLPETDTAGCCVVAERIRERIELGPGAEDSGSIRITASFGTVTLVPGDEPTATPEQLLQRADRRMYLAKQTGRNRVVSADS